MVDASQGLGRCGHDLAQKEWCGVWELFEKMGGRREINILSNNNCSSAFLVLRRRQKAILTCYDGKVNVGR